MKGTSVKQLLVCVLKRHKFVLVCSNLLFGEEFIVHVVQKFPGSVFHGRRCILQLANYGRPTVGFRQVAVTVHI